MARPKTQPKGAQGTQGGPIIYRERLINALGENIQELELEVATERQMLNNLTSGGRTGTAGGIRAYRTSTTGPAGGANAGKGLTNPQWIAQCLREHEAGLTAKQIREYAQNAGRQIHASFPHDSLGKMREKKLVAKRGERYFLKASAGTGPVARQGAPLVGRTRKAMGRAKTMHASG